MAELQLTTVPRELFYHETAYVRKLERDNAALTAAVKLALASRWLSIDYDHNRTAEACEVRHAMGLAIDGAPDPA